jgi:AcrR family transcriptional regulator
VARPRAHLDTDALARAFAPDGLHGTSLEEVARVVRLAKPTLYQRGGDKEELFALAVEAEVERLTERLAAPRYANLSGAAAALDAYLHERPDGARLVFLTAHHTRSRVAARVERALARIPATLEHALDADAVLAGALLGGAVAALRGGPPVRALAGILAHATPPPDAAPPELWTA